MQRIQGTNNRGTLPANSAGPESPGYFKNSTDSAPYTIITGDFLNDLQEEIANVVVDVGGLTLSAADRGQMAEALNGVRGIRASSTGLTSTGTLDRRVLIASSNSTTNADTSAVLASTVGTASGIASAVVASYSSTASAINSAAMASNDATASGTQSAVIACDGTTAAVQASGTTSAVIASQNGSHASGLASVVLACQDGDASGAGSAAIAGDTIEAKGAATVAMASDTVRVAAGANSSVLVASLNCELATSKAIAGGNAGSAPTYSGSDQNLTWRIESTSGDIYSDGTVGAGAADYAETFAVTDEGPHPVAALVTLSGEGCALAVDGAPVLGIVSAKPAVLGDVAPLEWAGRWELDEYGRRVIGDDGYPVEVAGYVPPTAERPYVDRAKRPDEWTIVGLLGKLPVRVDDTVRPGDLVVPGDSPGVGTRAPDGWRPEPGAVTVRAMVVSAKATKKRGHGVARCLVR